MPRVARELKPIEIKRLSAVYADRPTLHAVGGVAGLHLQVTPSGARSWVLRLTVRGKRREMGLGPYPEVSLALARDKAREAREISRKGNDPIEQRQKKRRESLFEDFAKVSFSQAVEEFIPIKQQSLSPGKYRDQWGESIFKHAYPVLQSKAASEITIHDVRDVLNKLLDKPATYEKLRLKMKEVFDYCNAKGYRSDDNPAIRKKMNLLVGDASAMQSDNYPALQLRDVGRFWLALNSREGMGAAALRFQTMTAARAGAVRFMTWDEIDFDEKVWTVQPGRQSSKIPRRDDPKRVPLTSEMIKLLKSIDRLEGSNLVFWAPRGGALSDATMGKLMHVIHDADVKTGGTGFVDAKTGERVVPHGTRSTFKVWATEREDFDWNLSEAALWHRLGTKVERAYARSDMLERRRNLMQSWVRFLFDSESISANKFKDKNGKSLELLDLKKISQHG